MIKCRASFSSRYFLFHILFFPFSVLSPVSSGNVKKTWELEMILTDKFHSDFLRKSRTKVTYTHNLDKIYLGPISFHICSTFFFLKNTWLRTTTASTRIVVYVWTWYHIKIALPVLVTVTFSGYTLLPCYTYSNAVWAKNVTKHLRDHKITYKDRFRLVWGLMLQSKAHALSALENISNNILFAIKDLRVEMYYYTLCSQLSISFLYKNTVRNSPLVPIFCVPCFENSLFV